MNSRIPLVIFLLVLIFLPACRPADKPTEQASLPIDTARVIDTPSLELKLLQPPPTPDYDTSEWTEVIRLDSTIRLDLRYATVDNFVGIQLYECARCFLRPPVARALVEVQADLREQGMGLKLYDCFRPTSVQWALWEKIPDRRYVADPRRGSTHSRGNGIDLTLVDTQGRELPMGTTYDYFGPEAYTTYEELPGEVLANRRTLSEVMRVHGFRVIRTEWWHFNFPGPGYELSEMTWNCPPPFSN